MIRKMMIRKMINPNPNLCGTDFSNGIPMPTCLNSDEYLKDTIERIKKSMSNSSEGTVQSMKSSIRKDLSTVCTFPTR